jgi:hypothetical protein
MAVVAGPRSGAALPKPFDLGHLARYAHAGVDVISGSFLIRTA